MKTIIVFTLFFSISVFAQAQYPTESLWPETGRLTYQTTETTALCVSWGDSIGIKEVSLFLIEDPNSNGKNESVLKESKKLQGGTGYQVYFIFLEKQTGIYVYQAYVTNMKSEVFKTNKLTLTFTYPVGNPSIGQKKYESNGWVRVWGDYNNDKIPEWSMAALTALLPNSREWDMNGDGAINILDFVLYNKWLQGKYNPNLPNPVLMSPSKPKLVEEKKVTAWAKIKTQ